MPNCDAVRRSRQVELGGTAAGVMARPAKKAKDRLPDGPVAAQHLGQRSIPLARTRSQASKTPVIAFRSPGGMRVEVGIASILHRGTTHDPSRSSSRIHARILATAF